MVYNARNGIPQNVLPGDVIYATYSSSGAAYIKLPAGRYKFECWGARGGYAYYWANKTASYTHAVNGGAGGYASGIFDSVYAHEMWLYPGNYGGNATSITTGQISGGWNGGGTGMFNYYEAYDYAGGGAGGGGGTDIRIDGNTLYHRILVAGGGGGATGRSDTTQNLYGAGGGWSGYSGNTQPSATSPHIIGDISRGSGPAGTLVAGGSFNHSYWTGTALDGAFGQGGSKVKRETATGKEYGRGAGAGGGGGWYGGGASVDNDGDLDCWNAGGGSSYVWCSSYASYAPQGKWELSSDLYLTNPITYSGMQTMPNYNYYIYPDSGYSTTMTGNVNAGYVIITVLGDSAQGDKVIWIKMTDGWKAFKKF